MTRGTSAIYFKSLNRNFNVLGVDRQLFFLFVGVTLPIAFSARLLPFMDAVAFAIFIFLYIVGVLITRVDNQILTIYRRHIHYKKYYQASPSLRAKMPLIKASVPFYQGKRGLI
jgi:type IV secretory pathway TrbD component